MIQEHVKNIKKKTLIEVGHMYEKKVDFMTSKFKYIFKYLQK